MSHVTAAKLPPTIRLNLGLKASGGGASCTEGRVCRLPPARFVWKCRSDNRRPCTWGSLPNAAVLVRVGSNFEAWGSAPHALFSKPPGSGALGAAQAMPLRYRSESAVAIAIAWNPRSAAALKVGPDPVPIYPAIPAHADRLIRSVLEDQETERPILHVRFLHRSAAARTDNLPTRHRDRAKFSGCGKCRQSC